MVTSLEADHELDERINVLLGMKQGIINGAIEPARVKQGERVVMPAAPAPKPAAPAPKPAPVVEVEDDFADLLF